MIFPDLWLAVDGAVPPDLVARESRREWERFLSGDPVTAMRAPVADSWRRSLEAGVDPSGNRTAPVAADRREAIERLRDHPLGEAAPFIRDALARTAAESNHLIVLSDAEGMLLMLEGPTAVRSRAADSMNFTEGALWSEAGAGTNAIGTAIAADHAVQIFATEHFNEVVQAWTCSAAPIHDPETGELIGVVDLTGLHEDVRPDSLAVAMTTAHAVEAHLRQLAHARHDASRGRCDHLGEREHRDAPEPPAVARDQTAVRRLATAAAQGASPEAIFALAVREIASLLGADAGAVVRYEHDGTRTVLAGEELEHSIAAPIVVRGRVWGAVVVSTRGEPLPAGSEQHMECFTELLGIVIANAASRVELVASRARAVAAADEARRSIQRDLHDGAQQRLVSTIMSLRLARAEVDGAGGAAVELLDEALAGAEAANAELRELAHGILPAALSRGGLRSGIAALVSRVRLPVTVDVTSERLPPALEATAYFIVAEALTNTVKHASATNASVKARVDGEVLRLAVRDDGVGGARFNGTNGLLGLRDRAAALDGELRVDSPPGRGTVVAAALPVSR